METPRRRDEEHEAAQAGQCVEVTPAQIRCFAQVFRVHKECDNGCERDGQRQREIHQLAPWLKHNRVVAAALENTTGVSTGASGSGLTSTCSFETLPRMQSGQPRCPSEQSSAVAAGSTCASQHQKSRTGAGGAPYREKPHTSHAKSIGGFVRRGSMMDLGQAGDRQRRDTLH